MSYGTWKVINRMARGSIVSIQSGIEKTVQRSVALNPDDNVNDHGMVKCDDPVALYTNLETETAKALCVLYYRITVAK